MLDTTLSTEFVPGTNVKGAVAGANWLFLLPSLTLDRVICFGAVSAASLTALARTVGEVIVWAGREGTSQQLNQLCATEHLSTVRQIDDNAAATLLSGSVALVVIAEEGLRRLGDDQAAAAEIQRLLAASGLIYFEQKGLHDHRHVTRHISTLAEKTQRFWLTPIGGEMHTAVPTQDQPTMAYFLRHGLTSRSVNLGALKRSMRANLQHQVPEARAQPRRVAPAPHPKGQQGVQARAKQAVRTMLASLFNSAQGFLDGAEQRLSGSALFGGVARRYGVLAGGPAAELTEQPPRYLREIAHAAGVDIRHHRWGLSARGEYSSRKVLTFLFNPAAEKPEYIVKMTRDAALNPRLENEQRALSLLAGLGVGDRETLPHVAFFGHHHQLAVLAETIVDGAPFEGRASGNADCPYARDAIGWLVKLGAITANRTKASPLHVAEGLSTLFNRFGAIYRLSPAHNAFLAGQIAAIARSRDAFPLVFQHGDPGTWNAMVTPAGHVAFLDWEAAEPQGMPLWDVFYFIRTYGAWAMRSAASGDVIKGFATQFLNRSPFQSLLIESTQAYCAHVGLPTQLVEPLFYTCWMHRALKESTRLTPNVLERGHYVSLLRASIDQRDALRDLFLPSAPI